MCIFMRLTCKKNCIISKVLILAVSQYKHTHWTKNVMVLNSSDLVEVKNIMFCSQTYRNAYLRKQMNGRFS